MYQLMILLKLDNLLSLHVTVNLLIYSYLNVEPKCISNYSYYNRIPKLWNNLPCTTRSVESVSQFRSLLFKRYSTALSNFYEVENKTILGNLFALNVVHHAIFYLARFVINCLIFLHYWFSNFRLVLVSSSIYLI